MVEAYHGREGLGAFAMGPTATRGRVATLLAANALPIVGVLFLGWDLGAILVLYWIESGLSGIENVPKMLLARRSTAADALDRIGLEGVEDLVPSATLGATPGARSRVEGVLARVALAVFFVFHYGVFWMVHGLFVLAIAAGALSGRPIAGPGAAVPFPEGLPEGLIVAIVGLGLSHLLSLKAWIDQRDYLQVSPLMQMFQPYGRVFVLHLTILLGGVAVGLLGQPVVLLVVLAIAKTWVDLRLHDRAERRRHLAMA
jgi:hypothetical protein